MNRHLNDFRGSTLDAQRMLRLPVGPEFWGAAGPHQIHELPPLGVVAACRWAWRGVVAWLARRRPAAGEVLHPAPLAR